jgi:hypothetical protein
MTTLKATMKKCQNGTRNYNEANALHAECYGQIGALVTKIELLQVWLAQYGIVDFNAIEDSDNYDNGETLRKIERLKKDLLNTDS